MVGTSNSLLIGQKPVKKIRSQVRESEELNKLNWMDHLLCSILKWRFVFIKIQRKNYSIFLFLWQNHNILVPFYFLHLLLYLPFIRTLVHQILYEMSKKHSGKKLVQYLSWKSCLFYENLRWWEYMESFSPSWVSVRLDRSWNFSLGKE